MKIFRYFMIWFAIVPIIALLFSKINNTTINIGNEIEPIQINLELPFTWELLWIASLIFLIAWILYFLFCPEFIRKYPSYNEYLEYDHDPRWIIWESKKVITNSKLFPKFYSRLTTKKLITADSLEGKKVNHPIVEERQTKIYFNNSDKVYSLGLPIYDQDEYSEFKTIKAQKTIFWEIFGRFSSSKKHLRLFILILFFISIGLVFINVMQNIWNGLSYVLQ